ncbi:MAG: CocE/NonD family hydrolase [Bacteroidota bacterium]
MELSENRIIKSIIFVCFFFSIISTNSKAELKYQVFLQQAVPMRDGVKLSADLFLQNKSLQKSPALFVMTPYTSDRVFNDAVYFAENGYNVVVVDCRGRGNSEGRFVPFENEGKDGFDVCKWIEQQTWSNGKIGMFGGSYLGMIQWLVLKEKPPALKSVVPTACVGPGIDFPKQNNIFYSYNVQWLAFVYGKASNTNTFTNSKYWDEIYSLHFIQHIPYNLGDVIAGIKSENYQNWLKHPDFDDYYKKILPNQNDYANIEIPVLTITGHFDDDQPGTMNYYKSFMKYGNKKAKGQSYIIIGPWDHGGTRRPSNKMGNLTFGENAIIDMNKIHLEWFNRTLNNSSKPEFLKDNAAVYETGTNEWKYAPSLEAFTNSSLKFYLGGRVQPGDTANAGVLSMDAPQSEEPDMFRYFPLDTNNSYRRFRSHGTDFGWREESDAFFQDKLIYHSAPLEKDIRYTGFLKFSAYFSMDVPDTDFEGIMYAIEPDGTCVYLSSTVMRAKYRNSLEKAELCRKDEIYKLEMNTFHFTSRMIKKGSRFRFVFGSLNSPYYQKNYNSGKDPSFETARDAKDAAIKIYHDSKHQSFIEIPVAEE